MLVSSKLIKTALESYGYEQIFLIGSQGSGKTSYALLVAYELLGDWKKAFNSF